MSNSKSRLPQLDQLFRSWIGETHGPRLAKLLSGLFAPPPGRGRILTGVLYGLICHLLFAAAVMAMIIAMFFGMSASFGQLPWPWAIAANTLLLLQFPLAHSLLLTRRGGEILAKLGPGDSGATLSTTTYAIIASAQLLLLFTLWTPSGVVWHRPEGPLLYLQSALYAASWLLLIKASFDAGAEVQSGALGWISLVKRVRPVFPDMPETGLFRIIRQPIYLAFAFTLWTAPFWTPDQLAVATVYTAYCVLAPRLKERRFADRYGERFDRYRARVPYMAPRPMALRLSRNASEKGDPDAVGNHPQRPYDL